MTLMLRPSSRPDDRTGPNGLIVGATYGIDRYGTLHFGRTSDFSVAGVWGQMFPFVHMVTKVGNLDAGKLVRSRDGITIWVDSHAGRVYQELPGCLGGFSRAGRAVRAEVAGRQYVYRFRRVSATEVSRGGARVMLSPLFGRPRFAEGADPTDIAVSLLIEWAVGRGPMQIS